MIVYREHIFEGTEFIEATSDDGRFVIYNGFEYGTVWICKTEFQPCAEGDRIPDGIDEAGAYEIIFGGGDAGTIEHASKLRDLLHKASASLPDEDALAAVELFPAWEAERLCKVDERLRYGGKLYRCVQAHTSQEGWEPDKTPALWTEVAKPGEIPVWRQPTGAQDAYNKGDRVHYPDKDGPVYESTIDNNVWSPEAYPAGWRLV